MSGPGGCKPKTSIAPIFSRIGGNSAKAKAKKRPSPLSLRLTEDQRAELERRAGRKPLGGYVKECLFQSTGAPRKARAAVSPVKDHQALARVLRALGSSELTKALAGILRASDSRAQHISPESEQALRQACADISAIRRDLVKALGLRAEIPS